MGRRKLTPDDIENNARVGARLRKVMAAYEMTQAAFADQIGISRNGLSEILSGEKGLDVNVARRIREKFGVSLDYLYCGDHSSLSLHLAHSVLRGVPLSKQSA